MEGVTRPTALPVLGSTTAKLCGPSYLGDKANFAVDREAAERAYAVWPGGLDGVRADVRAHRALLGRVGRYLAAGPASASF